MRGLFFRFVVAGLAPVTSLPSAVAAGPLPVPSAPAAPALPTAAASVPDECVLNAFALKPQLSHDRKLVRSFTPPLVAKDALKESLVLKDGVGVVFEKSGCTRLAYSFTFTGYRPPARADKAAYLDVATSLLNAVPTVAASPELTTFKSAVAKAKTTGDRFQDDRLALPCGAAACELNAKAKGKLIFSYMMAL